MYKFFKKMKTWTEDFEPNEIFYKFQFLGRNKIYTKLGKWFADKPEICEILKFPYYILAFIYQFISYFIWRFVKLFLPRNWNL